jgi:anti-sigma factor RsiW
MNCQSVMRVLSACQDGELDPARRREVASHLEGCPSCRAEWDGLQELARRLRLSPPPAIDPFFPARVMAGLRPAPAKKYRLLPAAAYALVFAAIFLAGFLLQTAGSVQAPAEILPDATFSAVLLEPQDFGLLAVQEDTLKLFNGGDRGQK